MKKLLIVFSFFLLMLSGPLEASHIVGGEFTMLWKGRGQYSYRVGLNMYFDDINAEPGLQNQDQAIEVFIFEKNSDSFVESFKMNRVESNNFVEYESAECEPTDLLRTRIMRYEQDISLDPAVYNDPGGYYMVWERCCRNEIIDNIVAPGEIGTTFYMEFPPVVKNGSAMTNTSPSITPIYGAYLCLDQEHDIDFSATDPNGDSLVYSLVTPYAGHTNLRHLYNEEEPAPYDDVQWLPGYDVNNMITGNPSLTIDSHTGILSVTPDQEGVFVMAMKVEEYRDGEKIGEVRRDFQYMVVQCPPNYKPELEVETKNGNVLLEGTTLEVAFGSDTCFSLNLFDSTALSETENLKMTFLSTDLPSSVISLPNNVSINPRNPRKAFDFCVDACNKVNLEVDKLYDFYLIVEDDGCPVPLNDTVSFQLLLHGMPNADPAIGIVPDIKELTKKVGDVVEFDVYGTDQDAGQTIQLKGYGENFLFSNEGVEFNDVEGTDSIASKLRWQITCDQLRQPEYHAAFTVNDTSCNVSKWDTLKVKINVIDKTTEITEIKPSNLFTPNGDNLNDTYTIPSIPPGNCQHYFVGIEIFNRWGGLVYKSSSPDFEWDGKHAPDGIYYYVIDLNDEIIKGWLSIVR